ncbi:MAG: DNA repair protein RadA [Aquificaceae bacterium]|nr:DNA repair protein RadA [Aquificaceae bacterium]MDW8423479.1 DNA repair protein RadA [Aquificaceae bacterium]
MKREKSLFVCQECGFSSPRWLGKCPSCGSWNSMVEEKHLQKTHAAKPVVKTPKPVLSWEEESLERLSTGFTGLDQSLGGGIVKGQVILLAGEPGIGKSTLLLQISNKFSEVYGNVLYVSGEESTSQIAIRARRLGIQSNRLFTFSETNLEALMDTLYEERPNLLVVDSIQTLYSSNLESSPGSVAQVRECAFKLSEACKELGIPLFLVGQVNKEGAVAGPKVLEHLVDTVLYFEGERFNFYRVVKVVKNRFGAGGNLAFFKMSDSGLEEVPEPSAFFLQERVSSSGSVIFPHTEGSKPVLLEVQALTIQAIYTTPQRRTHGFDLNRLSLILAVLEKEAKIFTRDRDVFVNVVGGVRVDEPAADLAVALAVVSSVKDKPVGDIIVYGELGLSGEVRSVHFAQERLKEGLRFGFKKAVVPRGSYVQMDEMEVLPVKHIKEAVEVII